MVTSLKEYRREYYRRWRARNRDKLRAYQTRWNIKNLHKPEISDKWVECIYRQLVDAEYNCNGRGGEE